jgi:hypothetical protein
MPYQVIKWECNYCGEEFDTKGMCILHEKNCSDNPDNLIEEQGDSQVESFV